MAAGPIKTIRDDQGCGFIRPNDGSRKIFPLAAIVEDITSDQLRKGYPVPYGAGPNPHDPGRM